MQPPDPATVIEDPTLRPDTRRMLPRFDRVERVVHWVNASLFGILMATGAVLYVGQLSVLVGRRELMRTIHVYAGLALPIPLLIGVLGRHGTALRLDLGRLNRWSRGDFRWFRRRRRDSVRLGKFNPGQKLNATFLAAAGLVMLGTGSIMKWFGPFSNDTAHRRHVRARLVRVRHLDRGVGSYHARSRGSDRAQGDDARRCHRHVGAAPAPALVRGDHRSACGNPPQAAARRSLGSSV